MTTQTAVSKNSVLICSVLTFSYFERVRTNSVLTFSILTFSCLTTQTVRSNSVLPKSFLTLSVPTSSIPPLPLFSQVHSVDIFTYIAEVVVVRQNVMLSKYTAISRWGNSFSRMPVWVGPPLIKEGCSL